MKVTPPDTYSIVVVVKTSRESYALTNWAMLTTLHAAALVSSRSPRRGLSQFTTPPREIQKYVAVKLAEVEVGRRRCGATMKPPGLTCQHAEDTF